MSPAEVVRAYLAALNAHDPDAVAALVSSDFYNEHTSTRGESVRGRDAYRARLDGFLASMTELHYEVERLAADGPVVVVAYTMSAGYLHAESVRPFELRGTFWFEVVDGLIGHRVDYRDGVDLEQQVGLR